MNSYILMLTLLISINCSSPPKKSNMLSSPKKSEKKLQIFLPEFVSYKYQSNSRISLLSIKEYGKDTSLLLNKFNYVTKCNGDFYNDSFLYFRLIDTFQINYSYEVTLMINKTIITNYYSDFEYSKLKIYGGYLNNLKSYKKNGKLFQILPGKQEIFEW